MILVDTSVIIDYLKGTETSASRLFDDIIEREAVFSITALTFQEVLQGAKNKKEYTLLKDYLSNIPILYPDSNLSFYEDAAKLYYDCRKSGYSIRSTVDVIIAQIAIANNCPLLHSDRDFDYIAQVNNRLKILYIK